MDAQMLLNEFDLLLDAPESVPKLREMILKLAIQGRITERNPCDEPADALLERIEMMKQRLYDAGEIRKPRTMSKIKENEKDWRVPENWRWVRLGSTARIVGGGTPKTKVAEYWSEKGIAWLTPGDLSNLKKKEVSRGRRDISDLGLQKSSAQLMPAGSVLFSSRAPIGYVAIAANSLATNQGFKSCRPYIMEMNEYLYYFLKYAGKKIDREASGTTFNEVSGTEMANITMPLPPIEEQKRIVATIDKLLSLCDKLETELCQRRDLHGALLKATLHSERRVLV